MTPSPGYPLSPSIPQIGSERLDNSTPDPLEFSHYFVRYRYRQHGRYRNRLQVMAALPILDESDHLAYHFHVMISRQLEFSINISHLMVVSYRRTDEWSDHVI